MALPLDVAECVPSYAELSRRINQLVTERDGEWCGLPMPLPGLGLVLEDRHPWAERIGEMQRIIDGEPPPAASAAHGPGDETAGWRVINSWRGRDPGGIPGLVVLMRHEDGRIRWGLDPDAPKRNSMLFGPLQTFDAWNLETECAAIDRLATLVTERQFKAYVLTGSFIWSSKRSDLSYIFRRCRPTIAMSPRGGRASYFKPSRREELDEAGEMVIVACLCLHPIGYYRETFGGAMTPTDDVIAHYLMARGDESLYWKRALHHSPLDPASGL